MTAREWLMARIQVDDNGCWIWQLSLNTKSGYAQGTPPGTGPRKFRVHRFAYELLVGPVPAELHLDHLCRVRHCVNPAHLEPVTPGENLRRSPLTNGNKTHCPRKHAYTPENTWIDVKRGGCRHCRACDRERHRERTALSIACGAALDDIDPARGTHTPPAFVARSDRRRALPTV